MKTVAFIPIKLNNERLPGKNTKMFYDGTPLIHLLQRTLIEVKSIDEIYVFCSDESVKDYILSGVSFMKRPDYLDTSSATPQDIIGEFMKVVDSDIYMTAHVTSPFVKAEKFEECVQAVKSGKHDSAFTAESVKKLLWNDCGTPLNFTADNIPRTQDLPPIYAEVSAAYVYTKEMFLRLKRRVGLCPHIVTVEGIECIDIDYPEDFKIANAVYKSIINKE